ncbi:MAG: hypothetical protein E6767_07310 [Dysgonomonas sp.]|nr:hypothetical protein [Dysgonomonas sp.]
METLLIVLAIVAFIVIIIFILNKTSISRRIKQPDIVKIKPSQEISNDKIVHISNINKELLLPTIDEFCKLYNENSYQALPKVYSISEMSHIITFPYDVRFEIYCYFVNYIFSYNPCSIKAWATIDESALKELKGWSSNLLNKKVIIYIPEDETDFECFYITTEENISFKVDLGFDIKELGTPIFLYERKPDIRDIVIP